MSDKTGYKKELIPKSFYSFNYSHNKITGKPSNLAATTNENKQQQRTFKITTPPPPPPPKKKKKKNAVY